MTSTVSAMLCQAKNQKNDFLDFCEGKTPEPTSPKDGSALVCRSTVDRSDVAKMVPFVLFVNKKKTFFTKKIPLANSSRFCADSV